MNQFHCFYVLQADKNSSDIYKKQTIDVFPNWMARLLKVAHAACPVEIEYTGYNL